jgi:ABC-type oligopeptide transport system ATPase subunit
VRAVDDVSFASTRRNARLVGEGLEQSTIGRTVLRLERPMAECVPGRTSPIPGKTREAAQQAAIIFRTRTRAESEVRISAILSEALRRTAC